MTASQLILTLVLLALASQLASIAVMLMRSRFLTAKVRHPRPAVSIVRPVCGIENHIEETLASAFAIRYPAFEIVFCAASSGDPVIPLVRRLMAEHPEVPARLLIGDDRISINPKLNNVVKGWRAARHDFIVMSDSNLLLPPDYLDRLLERYDETTGLVSSPPFGTRAENLGAELECAFLNTYQARWQLAADAFGTAFAQGKTLFCRRALLDDVGGISALATQPAEDAAATKIVRQAGLHVRLVAQPFAQPLGRRRLGEVWSRQLRWARLRRDTFGAWFVPEIFSSALLPVAGAAWLAATGAISWAFVAALALAWYGAEILLAILLRWPLSIRTPFLFVARDLMLPVLWLAAWGGSTFVWRGNAMDMRTDGRAGLLTHFRGHDESGTRPSPAVAGRQEAQMTGQASQRHFRAIFLSDLHLGRRGIRVDRVRDFLANHHAETIYLVGDIIEGWQPRPRLARRARHRGVLAQLARRARRGTRVVYVPGNHDEFIRQHCGTTRAGIELAHRAIHQSADGRRYLVTHGDEFDLVGSKFDRIAVISKHAYAAVTLVNLTLNRVRAQFGLRPWRRSQRPRDQGKATARGSFERLVAAAARLHEVDGVICGHFHAATIHHDFGFAYLNCGDWIDSCTALAERFDGRFELIDWSNPAEESVPTPDLEPVRVPA